MVLFRYDWHLPEKSKMGYGYLQRWGYMKRGVEGSQLRFKNKGNQSWFWIMRRFISVVQAPQFDTLSRRGSDQLPCLRLSSTAELPYAECVFLPDAVIVCQAILLFPTSFFYTCTVSRPGGVILPRDKHRPQLQTLPFPLCFWQFPGSIQVQQTNIGVHVTQLYPIRASPCFHPVGFWVLNSLKMSFKITFPPTFSFSDFPKVLIGFKTSLTKCLPVI